MSKTRQQFRVEPITTTKQATGNGGRWSDARYIREEFGIPAWNPDALDYPSLLPNVVEHSWDPPANQAAGGTDLLAIGKPGGGKSTLALNLGVRAMEREEFVVWRASTSRSEWLPLAPWATVYVPEGVDIDAELVPQNPTLSTHPVDLDDLVREVRRYANPVQLNNRLREGEFSVVYPDPRMSGCNWVFEESDKVVETPSDRGLFEPEDPLNHWWFAWVLARIERGPFNFTTWIADEIGDIAPESAKSDQFATYEKVKLLKDSWVDARKKGLSVYLFGHAERDIHNMIRHKIRWRMTMPGTANPTRASQVVGFSEVPMDYDHTSRYDVEEGGIIWSESNFESPIRWSDMPDPAALDGYDLNVSLEVQK